MPRDAGSTRLRPDADERRRGGGGRAENGPADQAGVAGGGRHRGAGRSADAERGRPAQAADATAGRACRRWSNCCAANVSSNVWSSRKSILCRRRAEERRSIRNPSRELVPPIPNAPVLARDGRHGIARGVSPWETGVGRYEHDASDAWGLRPRLDHAAPSGANAEYRTRRWFVRTWLNAFPIQLNPWSVPVLSPNAGRPASARSSMRQPEVVQRRFLRIADVPARS